MKMKTFVTVLLVMLIVISDKLHSQVDFSIFTADSSKLFCLRLKDDTLIIGNILEYKQNTIILLTLASELCEIQINDVIGIEETTPTIIIDKVDKFENPVPHKYLLNHSGYNLGKGEFDLNTLLFQLNTISYGITEIFSVGAGFYLHSTSKNVFDEDGRILGKKEQIGFEPLVSSKLGYQVYKSLNIAGHLVYIPKSNKNFYHFLITIGGKENNFSLGVWGNTMLIKSKTKDPGISFSGMIRISNRLSLITDNMILTDSFYIVHSLGLRILGNNCSFDLAFYVDSKKITKTPSIIPYISYIKKFKT